MPTAQPLDPATVDTQLADVELLMLALGHGTLREAARLLARFGDLHTLARAPVDELIAARLTPRRARRLHAALEVGRRALDRPLRRGERLASSDGAAEFLRGRLAGREQEELHVLGLDVQLRIVVHFVAAIGCDAEVHTDPRDIFRPLVRHAAHAAIVAHNHPSGDPHPSASDRALTERLIEAGLLVGVRVVDHVIVAGADSFSFAADPAKRVSFAADPSAQECWTPDRRCIR